MKLSTLKHISGYHKSIPTEEEKNVFRVTKTKLYFLLGYNVEVLGIISQRQKYENLTSYLPKLYLFFTKII
jgi:hypothetical protein